MQHVNSATLRRRTQRYCEHETMRHYYVMVVVMALFIGSSCRINTLVILCFRPVQPSHCPKYAYTTSRMCSFVHWIEYVCKINITVKCSIRPVGAHWLQVKLRDGVTTGTSSHPCHCCVLLCLCCIEYFCLTPLQVYLAEYSMFVLQEYLS